MLSTRRLGIVVGVAWGLGSACGGRTDGLEGDPSPDVDAGAGGIIQGAGGAGGSLTGGRGPIATGGRPSSGGAFPGGAGGAFPSTGGFWGAGGAPFPGTGGYWGAGGFPGTGAFPATGGYWGAGGFPGTGAFPGTGGYGGAGGGPVEYIMCPSGVGCGGEYVTGAYFSPCCHATAGCGVVMPPEYAAVLGTTGCVDLHTPGAPDPSCPVPGTLNAPGCCTAHGTCGIDLSIVSLGCVETGPALPCGTGGPPPVVECVAQARTDCERCACESCLGSMRACFADPGCTEIIQCVNATQCGSTDCYTPDTCQIVVDDWGGPGSLSTRLAAPLFACIVSNGCGCGF